MATIDTAPAANPQDVPALTPCEVITYLSDASGWTTIPGLFCLELQRNCNGIDVAALRYDLGDILYPGAGDFAQFDPLSIAEKYVRVTIPQDDPLTDITWIGYILDPRKAREGVKEESGDTKYKADLQEFRAVGLEYFLDRKQIDSTVIHATGESPDYVRIRRSMAFNAGPSTTLNASTALRGNRDPEVGVDAVYHFAQDHTEAVEWTAAQIVQYLLKYHTPVDSDDDPAPTMFILDTVTGTTILGSFAPQLATGTRTVLDLLNEICNPRRGLYWWAETTWLNKDVHDCTIHVATAATAAIELPSGGTLPANANQQTLDFDQQANVEQHRLERVTPRWYHRIIARGARMTTTCTVGVPDGTLDPDWSAAMETAYLAAASGTAKENDAYRRAERFHRVFGAFRIPPDWDGKTADGASHDPDIRNWAIPEMTVDGSILGGLPLHPQGIRLLNRLRIKRGWTYADAESPVSTDPDGTMAEYMPPFAFLTVETSPERVQFADKMNNALTGEGTAVGEVRTSYRTLPQESTPGIMLRSGRGLQHTLALNHWAGAEATDTDPEVDYSTLRATVCIEADAFAEATYLPAILPDNKPIEDLIINAGDNYRFDYMPTYTVYDIVDGVPQTTTFGGALRDDRLKLQDIARMAYEWYHLSRQSMVVTFRDIRSVFDLGMMILTLGTGSTQETLNTVVTRISYDLQKMRMTVETSDQALEARSLFT